MDQLLIALEDKQFGRSVQVLLTQKYNFEVLVFNGVTEAVSMLQILPEVRLVLCEEKFASKIGDQLEKASDDFTDDVKLLIIGKKDTNYTFSHAVSLKTPVQKVVHHIGYLLKKEVKPAVIELPDSPPPIPVEDIPAPTPVPVAVEPQVISEEASVVEEDESGDNDEKTTVFRMPVLAEEKVEEFRTKEIFKVKSKEPKEEVRIEYCSLSMKYFLELSDLEVSFNIYARVKKDDGFDYNIKVHAGSKISKTEIDRIVIRGGKELFVEKKDFPKASEILTTHFLNRLRKPGLTSLERMYMNSESYEVLLDVFKNGSMDKYSVEIVKELISSFGILLKVDAPLDTFFIGMNNQKLSYGYCHSFLTCALIYQYVDKFSWKKDQSKNKILYLALFHDMALHSDRLIKIHHNYAKEKQKLTEEENQVVLVHADAAATILETIVKAPKELTSIIREHHGLKHGKGFPEALSLGISPLSMAFIVTESFVTSYLELWNKTNSEDRTDFLKHNPEEIFNELRLKYDKLTYADIVAELQKIFVPKK